MYTSFQNSGLIDIKGITTFGVSSKANAETAIGYFGTGLKYAIAVLLREGCEIEILIGETSYKFTLNNQQVRFNTFDIVQMNGVDLAFTTELGKNWELWQAYRELYCNCIDENGHVMDSKAIATESETTIIVKSREFAEIHENNTDIILQSKPVAKTENLEVHRGSSEYLFYRNVRVWKLNKPSNFTYNLLNGIKLTEDRTVADVWTARYNLTRQIAKLKDLSILKTIIFPIERQFEFDFEFNLSYLEPSQEFLDFATELTVTRQVGLNRSVKSYVLANTKAQDTMYVDIKPNKIQQIHLNRAKDFSIKLGFNLEEYPIRIVQDLGNLVHGQAKDETIFISEIALNKGSKELAATLIEEYIHLKYRVYDETREMQNLLFDKLISMGELVLETAL